MPDLVVPLDPDRLDAIEQESPLYRLVPLSDTPHEEGADR